MALTLIQKISSFIAHHQLLPHGSRVLLGLSGGPDSVFLLHVLAPLHEQKMITLHAVHLDHEWRKESPEDAQFCRQLCEQLNIPLTIKKISELSPGNKFTGIPHGSKEEYARQARHHLFITVAHELQADRLALAHHRDDQEETFFIRLIRGAGLTGLTAMRPHDRLQKVMVIRPLLDTPKADILAYLHEHNLAYTLDATNQDISFLRNNIRHNLLPALRSCDKRSEQNVIRTINQLREADLFITQLAGQTFNSLCTSPETRAIPKTTSSCTKTPTTIFTDTPTLAATHMSNYTLNLKELRKLDPFLQQRVILHWLCAEGVPFTPTEQFFAEILRFLHQPAGGTHAMHASWSLVKQRGTTFIVHHQKQL